MTDTLTSEDVKALMNRIKAKSGLIVNIQRTADTEGFSCMGGAIGLQKLRQERSSLQGQLPPLSLVQ